MVEMDEVVILEGLVCSCLVLKTVLIYADLWQVGTKHKSFMHFVVVELFVVMFFWILPYEPEWMTRRFIMIQRIITGCIWCGGRLLLVVIWGGLL